MKMIYLGMFQSWPNGTDCKSVSFAFSGSNPLIPTKMLVQLSGIFMKAGDVILRVYLSGRAPAFQAGCEGSIPFTRSRRP